MFKKKPVKTIYDKQTNKLSFGLVKHHDDRLKDNVSKHNFEENARIFLSFTITLEQKIFIISIFSVAIFQIGLSISAERVTKKNGVVILNPLHI